MKLENGVDIVDIERIKKLVDNSPAFVERVYTISESDYCESRKASKYQSYAARFAAKEAVSKALGTGIGEGVNLKDIEVANDESGKPMINLYGAARTHFEKMGGKEISISLSHSGDYAIAYAVILIEQR